jgi:hypothetical protein
VQRLSVNLPLYFHELLIEISDKFPPRSSKRVQDALAKATETAEQSLGNRPGPPGAGKRP